jgi:hypothetical protein
LVARGGDGECVENVTHGLPWRLKETLHAWRLGPKKRLKRPGARVGCGGRDAENGSQSRSFLPPFHRYIDTYGLNGTPCGLPLADWRPRDRLTARRVRHGVGPGSLALHFFTSHSLRSPASARNFCYELMPLMSWHRGWRCGLGTWRTQGLPFVFVPSGPASSSSLL